MAFKQFWRKHGDNVWRIAETALIMGASMWLVSKLPDKINPPVQKPPAAVEFRKQEPFSEAEIRQLEGLSKATKSLIVSGEKLVDTLEELKKIVNACEKNNQNSPK